MITPGVKAHNVTHYQWQNGSVTEPGVWKWGEGYTKKRTYRTPFTSAVQASLAENLGASPPAGKKMNLGLVEIQFPMVLLALFSLCLVDLLSRSQFLLPPPYPHYFYANLDETHIFKKVGYVPQTLPWLRQCNGRLSQREWVHDKQSIFLLLNPPQQPVDAGDGHLFWRQRTKHGIQLKPWCYLHRHRSTTLRNWRHSLIKYFLVFLSQKLLP